MGSGKAECHAGSAYAVSHKVLVQCCQCGDTFFKVFRQSPKRLQRAVAGECLLNGSLGRNMSQCLCKGQLMTVHDGVLLLFLIGLQQNAANTFLIRKAGLGKDLPHQRRRRKQVFFQHGAGGRQHRLAALILTGGSIGFHRKLHPPRKTAYLLLQHGRLWMRSRGQIAQQILQQREIPELLQRLIRQGYISLHMHDAVCRNGMIQHRDPCHPAFQRFGILQFLPDLFQ